MTAVIALSALLGALAGIPLLTWGRRWRDTIPDRIERWCWRVFFPPLSVGALFLLLTRYPSDHAILLLILAACIAWVSARATGDRPRGRRAVAHGLVAGVLLGILASEGMLADAAAGGSFCRYPSLCRRVGGERAVPALIAAFRRGDRGDAGNGANAVEAAAQIGRPAVPALAAALDDRDPWVRFHAAWALGRIDDTRGVPALIAILKAGPAPLRRRAAEVLEQIGDRRAVPWLMEAIRDRRGGGRAEAATLLGRLGDARAMRELAAALQDSDQSVRRAAAVALEQIEVLN